MALTKPRETWSGSFGFILAAIGSAVGLGNIWRFPYVTGENGGAAFYLIYIGCIFLVGIPVMLAEILIGRHSRRNAVGAFSSMKPDTPWSAVGWLCIATGFIILSYYSVVGGWVLHYCYLALTNHFSSNSPESLTGLFDSLAGNSFLQLSWHGIFMLMTIIIVAGGINRGIELANKIMMPSLFLLLCALMFYALQTGGAAKAINFLSEPRWSQVSPQSVLEALGQALFSLSLGMAAMVTYGSYLKHDGSITRCALYIAAGDTLVATLSGFVIFPIVFTFGLEVGAGPSLIFKTLPVAFSQLPGGYLVALAFFTLLAFAALTSAMSLLEVVAAYAIDQLGWSRKKASWCLGGLIFALGVPSALQGDFLGFMDGLATNYLLPIGALLIAIFAGWAVSNQVRQAAFDGNERASLLYHGWLAVIRFISPVALILIFLHQLQIF